MSDPVRSDTPGVRDHLQSADRDAKIEQLLIAGLDRYFAGQHEQAIHLWTRVLFLDRGHPRVRAYIERARGAVLERQRESDELLQTGAAALSRGDVGAARSLLTSAVERAGSLDAEALVLLERVNRLDAGPAAAPGGRRRRPRARATALTRNAQTRAGRLVLIGLVVGLAASGLYAVAAWDRIDPLVLLHRVEPVPLTITREEPPVLPARSEIALERARVLFDRGRLRESLRMLDGIRPGDPLRPEAEQLRAAIQRTLLEALGDPPGTVTQEPVPARR